MKRIIVSALCLCFSAITLIAENVFITEFMANNDGQLLDEDGWHSDWIEIYNSENHSVDLENWGLSDKRKNPFKWSFPDITLSPRERLIVFASGRERVSENGEVHCSFKLDSATGYLSLTDPQGNTMSEFLDYPQQFYGVSYGSEEGSDSARVRYFLHPTPGSINLLPDADRGPILSNHQFEPALPVRPRVDQPITISIQVEKTANDIASVILYWRKMQEATKEIEMLPVGSQIVESQTGIAQTYTGTIPCDEFEEGTMIRWYIQCKDEIGHESRYPFFQNDTNSFEYFGTVVEQSLETHLPVLYVFPSTDFDNTINECISDIFYNGEFYDNVWVHRTGDSTAYYPKRSLGLSFPKDQQFLLFENMERYSDLRLLSNWGDISKVRNASAYDFFDHTGTPSQKSFQARIQKNTEFYGIMDFIEDGDSVWLERVGLDPDGALYKVNDRLFDVNSAAEKRTRKWEDNSDLDEFAKKMRSMGNINTLGKYTFDHINVPACVNYFATCLIMNHYDHGAKNYYLYCDSDGTKEWTILPWDLNLTWGRISTSTQIVTDELWLDMWRHTSASGLYRAFAVNTNIYPMVLCRLQSLMNTDMFVGETSDTDCYFLQTMREMQTLMDPDEFDISDMDLDGTNWVYGSWSAQEDYNRIANVYLPNRKSFLELKLSEYTGICSEDAEVNIQVADCIPWTSLEGISEGYICFTNMGENGVDLSYWSLRGAIDFTFAPGTVIIRGGTLYVASDLNGFRNRSESPMANEYCFVVDSCGPFQFGGNATLELVDPNENVVLTYSYEGELSEPYSNLRISEIMFAPATLDGDITSDLDNYAWLEVANAGEQSVNIEGLSIRDGITFTFPAYTLAAGERITVAKNLYYFRQRYPEYAGILTGEYSGNLARKGETISLWSPFNILLQQITYSNTWYPETDRGGCSLVAIDLAAEDSLWSTATNWAISNQSGGTPGYGEEVTLAPSIRTQPGDKEVYVEDQVRLKVYAVGSTPIFYQWYKDGIILDGATNSACVISSVSFDDAGSYTVNIRNDAGEVTSQEAILTVNTIVPPTIVTQPVSQKTLLNETVTFNVTVTGLEPISYQWYKNGTAVSGQTNASYVFSVFTKEVVGDYYVSVSNNAGSTMSDVVILSILDEAVLGASDSIIAVDTDSESSYPWNQTPICSLDRDPTTKYLNYGGVNSGFIVTPDCGSTIVNMFYITTADDGEFRDPASYEIYGTNDDILTPDNGDGTLENWSLITSGELSLPATRLTEDDKISFDNEIAYRSYKVIFPTKKTDGEYMQIGEFQFCGSVYLEGIPTVLRPMDWITQEGLPVVLRAKVMGTLPLSYQWYKDGVAIDGATDQTYNIESATPSDTGLYQLQATNELGSGMSNVCLVSVVVSPVLIYSIEGDKLVLTFIGKLYVSEDMVTWSLLQDQSGSYAVEDITADGVKAQYFRAVAE